MSVEVREDGREISEPKKVGDNEKVVSEPKKHEDAKPKHDKKPEKFHV